MDLKVKKAYEMYQNNLSLTQIATASGVSRQTIANWRKKHKWDEILLSNHSLDSTQKEQQFILELIKEWDKVVIELNEGELEEKLEILEKYTKLYYKLKNINETKGLTTKLKKQNIIKDIIHAISNIAVDEKNLSVAEFLNKNLDAIVKTVDD